LDGRRGKRGRERKERGEILNEDGREIRWMKEKWKRRNCIFMFVVSNPKAWRANKAIFITSSASRFLHR
jgi:hypothetical protein